MPGTTGWTRLEDDPLPQHVTDFASLAAAAVQRYPQVERVLVGNELKGFYWTDLNRWDQEGCTTLYNAVYRAVKAVRPEVQVGGPYVVAVDGNTKTRDGRRPPTLDVGAQRYAAVDRWLRTRTDLPIWWAECYPDLPDGVPAGPESPASAAATLAAVAAFAETGARAALLWGPQGDELRYAALWTDSTTPDGDRP